jgi:hypothetical protein
MKIHPVTWRYIWFLYNTPPLQVVRRTLNALAAPVENVYVALFGNVWHSTILAFVLHVRSPEIPTAPNNTAKIILEKGASQIWGDSKTSLPQGLGDCKPFDWYYFDGSFWPISAIGRVVVRPAKLRVPQELPSGYLKDSAPRKIPDICYISAHFRNEKSCDIIYISDSLAMANTSF